MEFIVGLFILLVAIIAFIALTFWYQGDENILFLAEQSSPFKLEKITDKDAYFSCIIPVTNNCRQDGTIIDAFPRVLLPYEQYDKVEVSGKLCNEEFPREDGYWEAYIVPRETNFKTVLTLRLAAREGNIMDALQEMVDVSVDIYYQTVGRGKWQVKKSRVVLMKEDIARELGGKVKCQN